MNGRNGPHAAMNANDRIDEVVCALSRYLRLHPFASDTLEGIRQWWLTHDRFHESDLLQALERLRRVGIVESVRAADGRVRYRRTAPDARVDAQLDRFIAGPRDP